ncbi:MAG: UDP-N-acetylmuramate dehydrogenase [Lachnospiraceae bacterium]|jgi:UDP-N-acetylmuramate dehydrogenase|nr:UDP-N-acetylmuramate dehydrogenase [Lachnospiraceae bacterium]
MIGQTIIETFQRFVPQENIIHNANLTSYTTFRIGGAADCLIEVDDKVDLPKLTYYLRQIDIPFYIVGRGSNLLVSDEGYRGVILHMGKGWSHITVMGDFLVAQAGATLHETALCAAQHSLSGLEFAAGIPGSVGGGVVMNAGAYGAELSQVVKSVKVLDKEGNELIFDKDTMEFGYRDSVVKHYPFLVTEVTMHLHKKEREAILADIEELSTKRKEKQPLEFPSAGSTFKRPQGYYAGELIMKAGLAGYTVGKAKVSEKHCGFVINTGGATAKDVKTLIVDVQQKVYDSFGVRLDPEVIFLGK